MSSAGWGWICFVCITSARRNKSCAAQTHPFLFCSFSSSWLQDACPYTGCLFCSQPRPFIPPSQPLEAALAACQWRRQWKGVLPLRDVLLHPLLFSRRSAGNVFSSLLWGGKRAILPHGRAAFLYASGGFPAYGNLIPAVRPVLLAGFPQESPLHLYAGNRPDSAFLLRERRRQ